jgi:hypothetical protein
MTIYAPYSGEATVLNLQGQDSVSSNAGPVAAGAAVLGNLVYTSGVGNGPSCMAGLEVPLASDSVESTQQVNPQTPGGQRFN